MRNVLQEEPWCYGNRAACLHEPHCCESCETPALLPSTLVERASMISSVMKSLLLFLGQCGIVFLQIISLQGKIFKGACIQMMYVKLTSLERPHLFRIQHLDTYFCFTCILALLTFLWPYFANSPWNVRPCKYICQRSEKAIHTLPCIYQLTSSLSLHFQGLISGTIIGVYRQIAIP